MSTLFISDLHLDESRPDISRAFFDFLATTAVNADALYILGDFFEAWIGDDAITPLSQQVCQALKALVEQGTPCFIMHGNRDFLIGEAFCQQSGCTLLPDPSVITLYGQATLLMHGDSLCTRDTDYIAFRQQARDPAFQQAFLSQGIPERIAFAKQLREQSKESNSNKSEDIMDVTPEEVTQIMASCNVQRLIHGHTHRPDVHALQINEKPAERIVLGDWEAYSWILTVNPDSSYSLDKFAIA